MSAITKVTSLASDAREAYYRALATDNAWQAELDARRVDRYSIHARGAEGTDLRALYDAKLTADDTLRELTDLVRRYQDPRQIGIEIQPDESEGE